MSSFNWFNRQYDAQPSEQGETEQPKTDTANTPETATRETPEAAPAIAEDVLAWAKIAQQNIQKRKAAAAAESAAAAAEVEAVAESAIGLDASRLDTSTRTDDDLSTPLSSPSGVDGDVEVADVEVADVEVADVEVAIASTDGISTDGISTTSARQDRISTDSTSPEPSVSLPETQPGETQPGETQPKIEADAAVLPFWARAEAERQERLERLKAAALELAEAEGSTAAAPVPAASEAAPLADAELDENFLWSAQVLAAQGRRADQVDLEEITWLKRLRQGLDKTRRSLINQLRSIVGQGPLNQDAVIEIESLLLQADVGVAATDYIVEALQSKLRQEALPPDAAIAYLKEILRGMLDNPGGQPINPTFAPTRDSLNIWLMTGVNGAGKTTTIGKIAHIAQKSGYKTLIGAADTFRAAAVQQVTVWGDRSNVEVISNPGKNTDPAAVVFDAIAAAQARHTELLLLDTAGRLQNKKNLMDELGKIRRIIDKKAPNAQIESLLVLDATLGQNGLRQAEVFAQAAQLSGVVLTKLDGTAKGGIALAVVQQLGLPIRFIGAGEGIEDLRPFSSYEFVEALLSG